ncbi:MAG: alpha-galactosidase, partial [Chloroflexi bacterium]|nr:alpha-galactosidase [Chloroflexota bacterium]
GMTFGLWFDPERASADTEIIRTHPGWFREVTSPEWEGEVIFPWAKVKPQFHINLALRQAQDGMIEIIDRWISKLDIRWVRWDYNIEPQPVWEKIDPTGKIQFAYMQGLYHVLDTLMSKHPQCFVECCASGGRRFDLGMARRAHTSWLSDHTVDPNICRYMQARSNLFWPGNFANSAVAVNLGEGDGSFSDMSVLSRMVGALSFGGDIASWSTEWSLRAATLIRRYKEIRHLLVQDFYQLSPMPATERDWDIVQFAARDSHEGVFFAFRYKGKTSSVQVRPAAIENTVTYLLKNLVDGTETTVSGKQLQERGVQVILELNSAGLWQYRKIRLRD